MAFPSCPDPVLLSPLSHGWGWRPPMYEPPMMGSPPVPGLNCTGSLCWSPPTPDDKRQQFWKQRHLCPPRISCHSPPSHSLYTLSAPLCALPGVPPSCSQPVSPHFPHPLAVPNLVPHPSPLGQLLMLLHCAVLVFWGWGVMGWALCGVWGSAAFPCWDLQAATSAVAWGHSAPHHRLLSAG